MTNTNKENQCPYEVLVEEVKERIRKLKEYGMSEKELSSLIEIEQPLLKLAVSRDYKLYLGGFYKILCGKVGRFHELPPG